MAQPTYYPYGEPKTAGGIDRQRQFGTYVRDSTPSAQDYAMQRYYSNVVGRFYSPDPGGIATANPKNPGSWNRYAYVHGDPVNFTDPTGMCDEDYTDSLHVGGRLEDCYEGDGGGGGGYVTGGDPCSSDDGLGFAPNPFCYAGPVYVPVDSPPPPEHQMIVEATSDCYKINVGASVKGTTVWERDINYQAVLETITGTKVTYQYLSKGAINGAVIQENLQQTAGQTGTPGPASAGKAGQPFEDTLSAGVTGPFQVTQTFTVTYAGVLYNALIQSIGDQTSSSNVLNVQNAYVSVNGQTNMPTGGRQAGQHPLCPGL
jgi:RHS repeat-associated protein